MHVHEGNQMVRPDETGAAIAAGTGKGAGNGARIRTGVGAAAGAITDIPR